MRGVGQDMDHFKVFTKMISKHIIILFGALVALVVLSAAENTEENSLTEEVAPSRLVRAADADPGKSRKKSRKLKKNKNTGKKKSRKTKKNKKDKSKRISKKAIKKEKKSKRKNNKASMKQKIPKKRKNKKSTRKNKNKKAIKKNKKSRKNKKANKKRKNKNQKKNRQQQRTDVEVSGTCVSEIVNTLNNKKATNFVRQLKRINVRLPKIEKKLGKASDYIPTLDELIRPKPF